MSEIIVQQYKVQWCKASASVTAKLKGHYYYYIIIIIILLL